jgi:hypothetical protein
MWMAAIVCVVLAVVAGGYWALRVHQRIGQGSLEHQIAVRETAPTVHCSKLQSDGAVWACGVIYRAESVCLIAKVNVLGSWSTAANQHRCQRVAALVALLPKEITAGNVGADVDRQLGGSGTVCVKVPSHQVRWACQRPASAGNRCLLVRVVPWTAWNENDAGRLCEHLPALQKKIRRRSA